MKNLVLEVRDVNGQRNFRMWINKHTFQCYLSRGGICAMKMFIWILWQQYMWVFRPRTLIYIFLRCEPTNEWSLCGKEFDALDKIRHREDRVWTLIWTDCTEYCAQHRLASDSRSTWVGNSTSHNQELCKWHARSHQCDRICNPCRGWLMGPLLTKKKHAWLRLYATITDGATHWIF